ncbi:molybdenum cofactor biosysynthesis protein [Modestobacter sp. VKM Ac-2983]|uniref:molybdenum cofactor biosysynthesis protein n=1 Tax=Modestobacter sp. VKM Ac-2983 TaxID=3004137 RepID=UPI0022ABB941|nr:molybdenum cofactor biosysynthesis protein [Modestobacter sp. VKM Ac-2983]MCZ2805909.1 molybdenum cofactor biosysynthesis protein [Modestobacter sp. VKM Ac-2983]
MADDLPYRYDVEVVGLLASPAHRYDGRPAAEVAARPVESQDRVEVRAGLGVVGDRYFGRPAHRDASVTVLAVEALEALAQELGSALGTPAPFDPLAARRNVVLRGAEVEALRGQPFSLDCGEGVVVLAGGRPAHPCAWMDLVLAPGAHRGLRGRGGVRCAPRTNGVLRIGPAVLRSAVPLDPARAGVAVRPAPRPPTGRGRDQRSASV